MLIDYLIPSRARRALLRAARDGAGRTVRELARAAGVPYSAAHLEMGRMAREGLVRKRRDGNAWHCAWNASHPAARRVSALLGREAPEAGLIASLKRWGAPLTDPVRAAGRLPLEETLARAIPLSRRRPDLLRVWPIVLADRAEEVDLPRLAELVGRLGEKRALGFLLALTGRLARDARFSRAAARLRDRRARAVESYFRLPEGKRAARLAEARTPSIARRWLFRLNMPMDTFEDQFRKYRETR
jgi:hypothetical protein